MDKVSLIDVIKHRISKYKLPIIIVLIVSLLTIVVISAKVLEISENPAFCGKNCHIMRPYYDSWRTSSHADVKCVECHYEPGIIGHVKGKICLLYTSDAADDLLCVDLGGRRIIKKKNKRIKARK